MTCSAARKADQQGPAAVPVGLIAAAAAAVALSLPAQPVAAVPLEFLAQSQVASIRAVETAKAAPKVVADVAEVATDLKFQPEQATPSSSLSAAQEAAARANPPPFDPAVIGGTAGLLLLAFGFSTGRADPQLKMNSGGGGGGGSSGAKEDGGKVAEVQGRKKQARAWIGDWQKRTKKQ
ncbi:hypothetical protein WJX74_008145 [Apatococcus lobatus]|uniref:Uncharacterized protein n=2 Tax=Apatococcus TaxID=904362 RepID=A0AAW1SX33_9CHLO